MGEQSHFQNACMSRYMQFLYHTKKIPTIRYSGLSETIYHKVISLTQIRLENVHSSTSLPAVGYWYHLSFCNQLNKNGESRKQWTLDSTNYL